MWRVEERRVRTGRDPVVPDTTQAAGLALYQAWSHQGLLRDGQYRVTHLIRYESLGLLSCFGF